MQNDGRPAPSSLVRSVTGFSIAAVISSSQRDDAKQNSFED